MTELLFEVEKLNPKYRCRNCIHLFTHQWNSGYKYCHQQRSNITGTGFKKIKARDLTCIKFELKK